MGHLRIPLLVIFIAAFFFLTPPPPEPPHAAGGALVPDPPSQQVPSFPVARIGSRSLLTSPPEEIDRIQVPISDPPSQQVPSFPVAKIGSRSLLTSPPEEFDGAILLSPDGSVDYVDRKTNNSFWSVSLGGNLMENIVYNSEYYLFVKKDLSLYEFTSGEVTRNLGLTIEEFIEKLHKGNVSVNVVGSVKVSVRYFDDITGRELLERTSSGLLDDVGQGWESGVVMLQRIDCSLSSSSSLGKPLWSLKAARVIARIVKHKPISIRGRSLRVCRATSELGLQDDLRVCRIP